MAPSPDKDRAFSRTFSDPVLGIIPARYGSQRFPGKPLAPILGKPMFWHVWQRARQCPHFKAVYLATDDQRIYDAARELDVPVVMTRPDHASGTDRVLEAVETLNPASEAVIVNIQGDEPALQPDMLGELIGPFQNPRVQVATLARTITAAAAGNPDQVKVVVDFQDQALYFSRAPVPYGGDQLADAYLGHIGLYAFRLATLRRFVALGPGVLERTEKLEQLRLLENGIPIQVVRTRHMCRGVDRPEDIPAVIRLLQMEADSLEG